MIAKKSVFPFQRRVCWLKTLLWSRSSKTVPLEVREDDGVLSQNVIDDHPES